MSGARLLPGTGVTGGVRVPEQHRRPPEDSRLLLGTLLRAGQQRRRGQVPLAWVEAERDEGLSFSTPLLSGWEIL